MIFYFYGKKRFPYTDDYYLMIAIKQQSHHQQENIAITIFIYVSHAKQLRVYNQKKAIFGSPIFISIRQLLFVMLGILI